MEKTWIEALRRQLTPADTVVSLPEDLRPAAVLAILHEHEGELWLPLIVRPSGQGVHSGQIALPGGAMDSGDTSLAETALREAREEVGVDAKSLEILGSLPPVRVTVSGFVVVPFVAWIAARPTLYPNDAEVAAIIDLRVRVLTDPDAVREIPNPPGSLHPTMYEYRLPEGRLWGATARMLHSLGEIMPQSTLTAEESR